MIKVLFMIHDLGQGGAEKVLVNLVNNMDLTKFDISLIALFGGGVNERFLRPEIHYKTIFPKVFPGNSHFLKLLTPEQLHALFIKGQYDIEISYLEGPSARIISGCKNPNTKTISWIHVEQHSIENLSYAFRNEKEAIACYKRFDQTVCVSEYVKRDFCRILDFDNPCCVLYNTVESEKIISASRENAPEIVKDEKINLIAVGTLKESKGYERMLRIVKRLKSEGYALRLYILGIGPLQQKIEQYIDINELNDNVVLLGYKTNPYKYVSKCDLFVCASFAEGFSTATTEALILGVPVCTVDVSGMVEMLGENDKYGVVAENNEYSLYQAIKQLIDSPELLDKYKMLAGIRGRMFGVKKTVQNVEQMLLSMDI